MAARAINCAAAELNGSGLQYPVMSRNPLLLHRIHNGPKRRIGHAWFDLLQRGVDGGEPGVELGAESIHDGDDGERNTGGKQAILDGGRARLVSQKCSERFHASNKGLRLLSRA